MSKKTQKIVICGYYGHENFGDEAILRVILSKIKKTNPETKIFVLKSKNILSMVHCMFGADIFVFGGGSILQNLTSDASLLYYLSVIGLSKLFCKRKIMLANGIGPFIKRKIPRKILIGATMRTVNCFDFISVRDTDSKKFLQTHLPRRKIHLIPDPALINFAKINQELICESYETFKKDFLIYIPHANSVAKFKIGAEDIAKSLESLASRYELQTKILVLNEKEDLPLAREIDARMDVCEIIISKNEREAAREFLNTKFVISSRYHGSLLTAALQIPTLSVSNDPKICALCKDFFLFPASRTEILKKAPLLSERVGKMLDFNAESSDKRSQLIKNQFLKTEKYLNKILDFSV